MKMQSIILHEIYLDLAINETDRSLTHQQLFFENRNTLMRNILISHSCVET